MSKADPGQANLFEETREAAQEAFARSSNVYVLPAIRIMQSRAPGTIVTRDEVVEVLTSHGVDRPTAVDAVRVAGAEGISGRWLSAIPDSDAWRRESP